MILSVGQFLRRLHLFSPRNGGWRWKTPTLSRLYRYRAEQIATAFYVHVGKHCGVNNTFTRGSGLAAEAILEQIPVDTVQPPRQSDTTSLQEQVRLKPAIKDAHERDDTPRRGNVHVDEIQTVRQCRSAARVVAAADPAGWRVAAAGCRNRSHVCSHVRRHPGPGQTSALAAGRSGPGKGWGRQGAEAAPSATGRAGAGWCPGGRRTSAAPPAGRPEPGRRR